MPRFTFENATEITKQNLEEFSEKAKLDALQKELLNPDFLPTHEHIKNAFGKVLWDEDLWLKFCRNKEFPVYELFNEEYVEALAEYCIERAKEYSSSKENPLVILEIGAGNGRLSHFLGQKLEERAPGQTKIIATDSGEWNLKKDSFVESLAHKEALEKYKPAIVISSWMPLGKDFTQDIRNSKGVQEYILIGEADGGCCGDNWKTWGISEEGEKTPLYEKDGFVRENLDKVGEKQVCRTDCFDDFLKGDLRHSSTVSFRRKRESL